MHYYSKTTKASSVRAFISVLDESWLQFCSLVDFLHGFSVCNRPLRPLFGQKNVLWFIDYAIYILVFFYYINQIEFMLQTYSANGSCATFLFLPPFDVICDLLMNRWTATWNIFVNWIPLMALFCMDTPGSSSKLFFETRKVFQKERYERYERYTEICEDFFPAGRAQWVSAKKAGWILTWAWSWIKITNIQIGTY